MGSIKGTIDELTVLAELKVLAHVIDPVLQVSEVQQ